MRKNSFSFTFPGRKPEMKTISGKRYSITEEGMAADKGGVPSPRTDHIQGQLHIRGGGYRGLGKELRLEHSRPAGLAAGTSR